jgi:predicted MFS family arabinose efflux permease
MQSTAETVRKSEGVAEMAAFWALGALPWYLKPAAGLVSDAFPLFGTRRRHYLIVAALLASALWLLLGAIPRSYGTLLLAVMAINIALVFGSTVVGGLLVEGEKSLAAQGRLVSVRVFVESVCLVVAGPLAGLLAGYAFGTATMVGATIAFTIAPVAFLLLHEPARAAYRASALREASVELRSLLQSPVVWSAVAFIFFANMTQDFQTTMFYYVRDELKFPVDMIGWLRSVAGAGAVVAALAYGVVGPRVPLRVLLQVSLAAVAAALTLYGFYRSMPAAFAIEFVRGFVLTISTLTMMEVAVWATPRGTAAMGFALFMSALNAGVAAGDVLGSTIVERWSLDVWQLGLIYAGVMLLMVAAVPLLPRIIFTTRDGKSAT